jgi:DNA-binding ferritin-like protein
VLLSLVLLGAGWGYSKYLSHADNAATARATVAEQALAADKSKDAENALATAQTLAQWQDMVQALVAQNKALATAVASRQTTLVTQQKADSSLPVGDLANRLKTLGNAPDGTVSTNTQNQVILTQSGAVAVTQTLETIPVLTSNLKDEIDLVTSEKAEADAAADVINDQTKQIAGLNLTIAGEETQCKAQVAQVQAQLKRSRWHWFLAGLVTGFVGRSTFH